MSPLALGLWDDLREKRLWPVAVLLVVALLAVPILLRKPAVDVPVATVGTPATATTADGLPTPEAVLQGGGKPLVTLALLRSPSDLEQFDVKNPFQPLRELDGAPQDETATGTGEAPASDGGVIDGGGGDTGAGGLAEGGETIEGGGTPAPDGGGGPSPAPQEGGGGGDRHLTYTTDVTFDGPTAPERRFRNLPRLSMLPSEKNPRLIYLGVNDSGNGAVFLVDSTLQAAAGEGTCTPAGDDCATISLEPGEQRSFVDDQNRAYSLRVDQIRVRPVGSSSSTSSGALGAKAGSRQVRRFLPPVITDVLVRGGQR
jgi:hypothetical protein